jgi:hypothetical protein
MSGSCAVDPRPTVNEKAPDQGETGNALGSLVTERHEDEAETAASSVTEGEETQK